MTLSSEYLIMTLGVFFSSFSIKNLYKRLAKKTRDEPWPNKSKDKRKQKLKKRKKERKKSVSMVSCSHGSILRHVLPWFSWKLNFPCYLSFKTYWTHSAQQRIQTSHKISREMSWRLCPYCLLAEKETTVYMFVRRPESLLIVFW